MQKLQISYLTWTRSDANGLFDYEDLKDQKPDGKILVQKSGYIYRRRQNYQLEFSYSKMDESKFEKILKLIRKDNHFMLYSLNIQNEPLFKIIEKDHPKTHQIKKDDTIRLGKVVIEVVDLQFKTKPRTSSYQLIKQQIESTKMTLIKEITPSFYGQDDVKMSSEIENQNQKQKTCLSQSLFEQNPTCRYCYSKTMTEENHFIVSCKCRGSSRYIHENCLLEWILRKGQLQQKNKAGVLFAEEKIFKCELCHQFFYVPKLWRKVFQHQKMMKKNLQGNPFDQVLILHVKYQSNWLFFIDLSKQRDISIGRSLDNDMILNELSVSRQHAKLSIDSVEKVVTLSNNNAKFGTLVQIKDIEIQNDENYQVGRSKMQFRKHLKKSFLDKIGLFCFPHEKIKNQNPKLNRKSRLQMEQKNCPQLQYEDKFQE